MKKIFGVLIALILIIVLILVFQQNIKNKKSNNINSDVRINVINVSDEYLEYEIVNNGKNVYNYGKAFTIEKKQDNSWIELTPKQELIFTSEALSIESNGKKSEKCGYNFYYGKLEKGKYRIVKQFDLEKNNSITSYKVYGTFEID